MTSPLSPEREAEIRARAEAATPRPWIDWRENGQPGVLEPFICPPATGAMLVPYGADLTQQRADAEFIAHSRADVPDLLAEVDRLRAISKAVAALDHERAENQRLRDAIEAAIEAVHAADGWIDGEHGTLMRKLDALRPLRAALAAPTPEEGDRG